MGRAIIKLRDEQQGRDWYLVWSTVVDAPTTVAGWSVRLGKRGRDAHGVFVEAFPVDAAERWAAMAADCPAKVTPSLERRPGNALNLEIGQPAPRCIDRPLNPRLAGMGLRWLGSGGSPFAFAACSRASCPRSPARGPR